jgi:hypothetical protein
MRSTRIRPTRLARALAAFAAFVLLSSTATGAAAGSARAAAWDFDGDGRRDLAIGIAGENDLAGSIVVLRGTSAGLSDEGVRRFSQDSPGIPGLQEPGDAFGAAVASGDFDRDGRADLAVAAPGEGSETATDLGSITILYGTANGLRATGSHRIHRPDVVFGELEPESPRFGYSLAAGDFDHDGYADLVAAVDGGTDGVLVYRGSANGLRRNAAQEIGPGYGLSGIEDWYPDAMDVGDLDGNGVADLAIGSMETAFARGAVVVLYGARGVGFDLDGDRVAEPQVWTEDSHGVKGVAADLDAFGSAVGVGDVTGDGRKDLVVGVLQQPIEGIEATGALHVLRGSPSGVTATGDQYLTYDLLVDEPVGAIGVELAVGRLDGDEVADVAVTHGSMDDHRWGSVLVLYGSADGIGAHRSRSFTQGTTGIGGAPEPVDYWGETLAIRDVGRTLAADLIVGDPYEDVGGVEAGMVTVQWGSDAGVSGTGPQLHQNANGISGWDELGDLFGLGL